MRLNEYRKLRQMPNNLSNFRIQDAANYLGVSSKTLRRWGQSGKLVAKRSEGGHRYYTREQLDNFRFADKTETAVSPSPLKNKDYTLALSFTVIMLCIGLTGFDGTGAFTVNSEKNTSYNKQQSTNKEGQHPSVLAASDEGITPSVAGFTFAVNVPSKFSDTVTFLKDIIAPNVVNSVNDETGDITIDNSLVAGTGISITDRTISNSGIVTLSAGTGISVDGNKITNTYSFTPDYTLGGWTRTGTTVGLTTITDSVTVGALTAGAVTVDSLTTGGLSLTSDLTVSSGHSLLPAVDLGSDIGSSSYRFNNLWVANINSNSSQSFSGQTTFSYPPTDTTINQASVLINPTTSIANGQLLGLGIAGYERAVIDEDGDIILGYNSLTSPPTTDYPLDIYGHSATRVSFVDTSGNGYFAGNVGIGTSSPSYALDIWGRTRIMENSAGSSAQAIFNGSAITFYKPVTLNGTVLAVTGSGNSYFTGNVGIGTTSPSSNLHVYVPISGGGITLGNVDGGYAAGYERIISFKSSNKEDARITGKTISGNGGELQFHTSLDGNTLSQRMTISREGNVGIGTTSPAVKLEVSATTNNAIKIANTTTDTSGLITELQFWPTNIGAPARIQAVSGFGPSSGSAYTAGFKFITQNRADGVYEQVNAMSILASGLVGIGTTSPTSKLHVSGAVTGKALAIFDETGNQDILTASASGTTRFVVTNSGNVGIGTTAPDTTLHVVSGTGDNVKFVGGSNATFVFNSSSGLANIKLDSKTSSSYNSYLSFYSGSNARYSLGTTYGNSTTFQISDISGGTTNGHGIARIVINSSGNVGIGTTSPDHKLDVRGTAQFGKDGVADAILTSEANFLIHIDSDNDQTRYFQILANGSSAIFTVQENGNVGIGTTAPGEKLEVTGNIKTSSLTTGTVYSNNGVLTNTDPSDVNLKTNILNLPDGTLNKVLGLRTVSYDWKSTGDGALGFVAQEVQQVFPELVGTNNDGTLGLYTTQFIPLLTKAIQEQQLQIDEVKLSSASASITNVEWDEVNSLIATIQNAINEIQQKLEGWADKFRTKELCVGENGNETCVTKEQLDELLKLVPTPSTAHVVIPSPESSPEVLIVPTVSPTSVPTVEPIPTSSPSASPEASTPL